MELREVELTGLKAKTPARSKAQLGVELFRQGDYQKASDILAEALQTSETPDIWNDWATAEAACGRHEKAQEGFRRALSLEPKNGQALVNLGILLARSGRELEAIPLLRQGAFHVDEAQRAGVNQLLASCCRTVASEARRESEVAIHQAVAEFGQSSALLQPAPAVAPPDPDPQEDRRKTPVALEKYALAQGPKALTLESSSVCNLRCVMCVQGRGLVDRPRHFPKELVDKLSAYLPGVVFVQLHGIGEPMHSPAFWRFLETLSAPESAYIEVNSNMTVLTDDQIDRLLGSRLNMINVSVDAATAETYARIRGYDFNKVISNIRRLITRRNARSFAKPEILLNMTLMRENIEQLEAFVLLAHELGVNEICFWHLNPGYDYRIAKNDGWIFNYKEQLLSNYPTLSNQKIRAAMALAERIGLPIRAIAGKELFFKEAHETDYGRQL